MGSEHIRVWYRFVEAQNEIPNHIIFLEIGL